LERKLRRTVPTLLSHPALLAHTVYQALIFDSNMRELGYEFVVGAEAKKAEEKGGISSVILCQKEWFDAWLEGEKKCKFFFTCLSVAKTKPVDQQSLRINTMKSSVLQTHGLLLTIIQMTLMNTSSPTQ
jgi:hypothetical protein